MRIDTAYVKVLPVPTSLITQHFILLVASSEQGVGDFGTDMDACSGWYLGGGNRAGTGIPPAPNGT